MDVVVVGLGYVGAVTSACLAHLGHNVVGVDVDRQKTDVIKAGQSPIVEPGLDELVAAGRASGRLDVTTELDLAIHDADVVAVCVGTPARNDGMVNLEFVERVSREIGFALSEAPGHATVVYRSTVPPGTVRQKLLPLLETTSGRRAGQNFGIAMSPEFLREGSGIDDFFAPPFTIAGVRDERSRRVVESLFADVPAPFYAMTIDGAESLKYACNAFHALKVAFANELGRLLGTVGVDARDVMRIFAEDARLNISPAYLRPGFAFGGSCLPKDLRALTHFARIENVDIPVLGAVLRSNEAHLQRAVRYVLDSGARDVALLGLSFKPQTDDLRESPYVELAETLLGKGISLRIFDPIVNPDRLIGANRRYVESRLPHLQGMLCASAEEALDGAGIAVVATANEAVLDALVVRKPGAVLDLHGGLGPAVEGLPGYAGIAW